MKISACLLVRDDQGTLRACLESIRPHVDELVVVDTGSTDDSPAIAREFADKFTVFLDCNDSEELIQDFALARNYVLSLATGDAHFWADSDDLLVGGEHLRGLLASKPNAPACQWLIPYEYQHDAQGRVTCLHHRENLVWPRESFQWQTPVHEVMVAKPGVAVATMPAPQVRRIHRKQLSTRKADPQRNLRIMKRYVQKAGEGDVRALYYLGVEHANHGMIGDAFRTLRRYVQLSNWGDEKCLAVLELARLHQAIRDFESAIEWAQKAMITKSWPEPYWILAECFYELAMADIDADHNFRRCAHFAGLGMQIPEAETVLFTNPTKRFEIHRIYSVALVKCGEPEKALESVRAGLAGLPDDPVLQQNAVNFETNTILRRVVVDLNRLIALGVTTRETGQRVVDTLAGAPQATSAPMLTSAPPREQRAEAGCLDVVFFVGPGYEPWNPDTIAKTGIGGSETMAWELARRLRRLGHRVRLFGHCSGEASEGVFEGVEFLDATRYPGTSCDVLISSRQPTAVDDAFGVTARLRLLWLHDVHAGPDLDQRRALRFDRILALSEWHRGVQAQCYPWMDAGKVVVTRNGLDPARFDSGEPFGNRLREALDDLASVDPGGGWDETGSRTPTKVIYSSSPDRGLPCLLELWPQVLKAEPDAELHVFYGAANLEKAIAMTGDKELATMHRRTLHLARSMPSVKMRGRVNQVELAREMLSAGVWCLGGGFTETSCLGAAEAQAAGCHVVASALAALNETVGPRGRLVSNGIVQQSRIPPDQPESYKAEFAAAIVEAIGKARNGPNVEGMTWARAEFGLDTLASDWDVMIRELVAETDANVVPKFRGAA